MRQMLAPSAPRTAALPPGIFRRWFHSLEEDDGAILVYRPDTFIFPPGPVRHGFEMRADGLFTDYHTTPGGGIVRLTGRWAQTGAEIVAATFAEIGRDGYGLAIVALDDSTPQGATLRVRRLPSRLQWPTDRARLDAYLALPPATLARRLDWDQAGVQILESFPPQFRLGVSGSKPLLNLEVMLQPQIHLERPDYWVIEVVGNVRVLDVPAQVPYSLVFALDGVVGKKGIELHGATKRERFDLPTE